MPPVLRPAADEIDFREKAALVEIDFGFGFVDVITGGNDFRVARFSKMQDVVQLFRFRQLQINRSELLRRMSDETRIAGLIGSDGGFSLITRHMRPRQTRFRLPHVGLG